MVQPWVYELTPELARRGWPLGPNHLRPNRLEADEASVKDSDPMVEVAGVGIMLVRQDDSL
jgi:hypothetical protein